MKIRVTALDGRIYEIDEEYLQQFEVPQAELQPPASAARELPPPPVLRPRRAMAPPPPQEWAILPDPQKE